MNRLDIFKFLLDILNIIIKPIKRIAQEHGVANDHKKDNPAHPYHSSFFEAKVNLFFFDFDRKVKLNSRSDTFSVFRLFNKFFSSTG